MSKREKTQSEDEAITPDVIATRRKTPRPNAQQTRFAVELAKRGGKGAIEAARAAGYTEQVARNAAWHLLRKPHVRALVKEHLRAETAALEMTAARVLGQARFWAFTSDEEAFSRGWHITPGMRTKALEILARATGITTGDQHQHLHTAPSVQFVLPANDRVPIEGEVVSDDRGNGRGNGRDHEMAVLSPGAVLELPPLDDEE